MGFLVGFLTIVFILTSILLVVIILIQPHHSESGLAGAFGGGGSDSFLGTKAVSVATKITVVLAIIFLVLTVLLNKIRYLPSSKMTDVPPATVKSTTQPPAPVQPQPTSPPGDTKQLPSTTPGPKAEPLDKQLPEPQPVSPGGP